MIAWVRQFLVPELEPGQYVIMDNVSFHKALEIRKLIEAAGYTLVFLAPYSPDLNPIENFWAWLKQKIRETSQNFNTLQDAVDHVFNMSHNYVK
jgi:transposase